MCAMAAFTACGSSDAGNASASVEEPDGSDGAPEVYKGFFSAGIPEGFEKDANEDGVFNKGDQKIKVYMNRTPAAEEFQGSIDFWAASTPHGDGGTVEIGEYTWYVETWDWNGKPSVTYYADLDENHSVEINGFEIAPGDPIMVDFLTSFAVVGDIAEL